MIKYVLLQFGKQRSILENIHTHKHIIIDNQLLINFDEMGLVI